MALGRRVAGWTVRGYAASLLAGLALLAIALRTVLPPGFMLAPSQDPRSLIAMTLCSGVMSEAANGVAPDLSRGQDPAGPGDGTSRIEAHECAFCGLTVLASAPSAPDIGEAFLVRGAVATPPDAPVPGRGLAAPPPPQTGPPVLA